jgi:hypothetical protein
MVNAASGKAGSTQGRERYRRIGVGKGRFA